MRGFLVLVFVAIVATVFLFSHAISLYTDLLWFQAVGFSQIFTKIIAIKAALGTLFGGLFFLLLYVNLKMAARLPSEDWLLNIQGGLDLPSPEVIDPLIRRLLLPMTILMGFLAAPQAAAQWKTALLYFNSVSFGVEDPLFGYDIGFLSSCCQPLDLSTTGSW